MLQRFETKGLLTEGTLTKDAKPREVAVGGGDTATPGEEGRGGLGVRSWVQSQSLAEKGASPDGAAAEEHIPSLSAPSASHLQPDTGQRVWKPGGSDAS